MKKLLSANELIPSFVGLLPLIALFLTIALNQASAQSWQWAKSEGGTSGDVGLSVATDADGNVYMTGWFLSPTITFGTTTLNNAGARDIFLVKYDAAGNVLWAKSVGGTSDDLGFSVDTDSDGNVYITGYFSSPSLTFGSTTLTNAGDWNIFLVKYDADGNMLWTKSAEGTYDGFGYSVSTDSEGNVYMTGYFDSPSITFGTKTLINAGDWNIFLVKYDAAGNVLWANSAGGTSADLGSSVSTDAEGNVYMTGYFSSPSITFGTTTLTNAGGDDIFLVKYDATGTVLWAKTAGGTSSDWANSVSTDAGGNVYMTGTFSSPSITFGTTTLNKVWSDDIFLVKYDATGNVLWAKSAGGNSWDVGRSVSTDSSGNVCMTGFFNSSSITFGTTTLNNANAGDWDIFLVKYDAAGTVLWAESAGGTFSDWATSVSTDAGGNVYITGFFGSPSITFGTTTLTNTVNTGNTSNIFLAKLDGGITGVNEWSEKESFSVYPNPFSTQAVLQTDHPLHNATLTVYNSLGQTVKQMNNLSGQTIILFRDNLASGLYFLQLTEVNPATKGGAGKNIGLIKLVITDK